jgi:amidase
MTDVWRLDARTAAAAIRSKSVSSSELLEVYLERIDRHNPRLNAVVTIDADGARRAALAADDAVMRGEDLGPLHGLPITVKDALETKGMRSTGGATELRDHIPTEDAPAVARVKEAGAIVFAKTNAPKWSMNNQTHNELFGVTRNPWDDSRSPGGSSGGPAVSVACGFSAFEIGTDIGGSIRMPAHFTGICGHKPSFGIVPSRGYLDHVGGGMTEADINVVGPMARSVADLSLLLGILAGVDGDRAGGWRLDFPPARSTTRLGVWLDDPGCPTDGEVRTILEGAVELLRTDGAAIDVESRPVDLEESMRVFLPLISSAISPGLPDDLLDLARQVEAIPETPGEDPLLALGRGPMMRHRDWILVDEHRERLRRQWAAWFSDHDALLCPVGPVAAQPLSDQDLMSRTMMVNGLERPANDLIRWPGLIGVAYLPSTVVPVGRTSSGLPVGIQIVGPYLGDLTALRVAERLEALTGGYEPPPLQDGPG